MRPWLLCASALLVACKNDQGVSIHNEPPTATITAPSDGQSLPEDEAVFFVAQVGDSESGPSELEFSWSSSLAGVLDGVETLDGSTLELEVGALEPGEHTVTLTATDPGGESITDTVTFTVAANQAPSIAILSPLDGVVYDARDPLLVYVDVTDEDPAEALTIAWEGIAESFDPPAVLDSDGTASFYLSDLDFGSYSLTLRVTDTDGQVSSASTVFEMGAADLDGDGFDTDDCDDEDPTIHPSAYEICNGADDDCDGAIDEDSFDARTFYADADADGYGDEASAVDACEAPSGYVDNAGDCYDGDASISPAGTEACNGLDDDCDGSADGSDAIDATVWYIDADGDSYGSTAYTVTSCTTPTGYVSNADDCLDSDASASPVGTETCDGVDEDCDGSTDEDAIDPSTFYADADGDGFGDAATSAAACDLPSGYVADASDCDDSSAAVSPSATEVCNSVDDDCDGRVDPSDAADASTWYADADADGYGSSGYTIVGCDRPSGYADNGDDCDDGTAVTNPGATELCGGGDEDCDGLVDDADSSVANTSTWYADADGDGFGVSATTATACEAPSGYAAETEDCDETDATIHPDATEQCDGVDNDCDGVTENGWTEDSDGDGLVNCLDAEIFTEDFATDPGWTIVDLTGGNAPNWSVTGGYLYEQSNAAKTIAHSADLGEVYEFTVGTSIYNAGANNESGIVFGYIDSSNYYYARWSDPTNYYGTGASITLLECISGVCSTLATDAGYVVPYVTSGSWADMAVVVDYDEITVTWNGSVVLEATGSLAPPYGPYAIGGYSYDNDGSVRYEYFEVTSP